MRCAPPTASAVGRGRSSRWSPRCAGRGGGGSSRAGSGSTSPSTGALAACYRAQFLNVTLPGGVLGDVGRGVRHGRGGGDVGRGLRGGRRGSAPPARSCSSCSPASRCSFARPFDLRPVRRHVGDRGRRPARHHGRRRRRRAGARHRAARVGHVVRRRPACAAARPGVPRASSSPRWSPSAGTWPRSCSPPARSGVRTPVTSCCRWPWSCSWCRPCPSTWPGGARARAPRRGPSRPPGSGAAPGLRTAVAFGVIAFVAHPARRRAAPRRPGASDTGRGAGGRRRPAGRQVDAVGGGSRG